MVMNVEDAAQSLNTNEKTVLRWIKKGNLPAERIGGEYRINRVDLLEWATERGVKVNPALFNRREAGCDDEKDVLPSLSRALDAGGIHYSLEGEDMETVLRNVVALLKLPVEIDPEFLLQVLLAREALGTTAVGDGIAIPHVRNPILLQQLAEPRILLCFLAQPVAFGALDGKPVRVLFTLISPTVKVHLHLLSSLAHALRDPRLRMVLQPPGSPENVLASVRKIEHDLGRSSA